MLVAIWVTSACNMSCKYCYEGKEKNMAFMSQDTSDDVIKFVINKFYEQDDYKLIVNFHGGEPLLAFDLIKYMTLKFIELFKNSDKLLMFGLTTNGILLDEDKIQFLVQYMDWNLSVSLDGSEQTNDKNRILKDGSGSYNLVISKCLMLLKKRKDLRLRMTYTKETAKNLSANVLHFMDLGFNIIIPLPNYYDNWTQTDYRILYDEIRILRDLYNSHKRKDEIVISSLDLSFYKKSKCAGGISEFQITTEGELYPCSYAVGNNTYKLGNIYDGINIDNLEFIHKSSNVLMEDCESCTNYNCCISTRCRIMNDSIVENPNKPIPIVCALENIKYKIFKETNKT